ncbi:hypothetical protein [Streptomyces rubellomurinus]|uniref:Phospholipase D-like domain-containing protein n=1 Tax=Streptomyces rubellomurinus (strain ATCC 31215) TaxID=359131 RepID=A0A0F2TEA0_STRR3|nr:hypothetical protein [Streptomyces rubellomurinus]KJS61498.1 hypothetical protein VM95_14415 [Streptomyces rubellomurinus]
MNGTAQLAVPCRLVALKVLLGPESGLTTLEDLVARAIAAGRTTVESQVDLFRLPERIIVDVVHSLWSKGHILVRFDSGDLELADGARDMLTEGGLRDAATVQETRRFLFEPVTGQLFPEWRGKRFAPEGSLELPAHQGVTEADLSAGDLLEAVQAAIRHDRRRRGFRQNVLDVGFGSPVLRPPEELRWLSVRLAVRVDTARDVLSVTLIDDEHMWGMRARQRMAEHLAGLAEEQPDHEFVRKLNGRADRGLVPAETLDRLLDQLLAQIATLPGKRVDQIDEAQQRLERLAAGVEERIVDADRGRAGVVLVERAAGYLWAVEELIRSATTQLVVSSPLIRYSTLNALLPALTDRLAKGVGLVLLWGRSAADTLPTPVRTALNELKARYPTQVLFEDRSAQTDACLVVQDATRALFGSQSPLHADLANDQGEIGVLVEPAADGPAAPRCVADALLWARKAYPFAADGARIQLQPDGAEDGAGARRRARGANAPEPWPTPDKSLADEAAVRLWAESWAEYHTAVLDSLARSTGGTPSVELVRDSAHRDLISSALTTRSRRLAVTDDRIDPRVANDLMARRVRDVAAGGASVHLVHPQTHVSGKIGKAFAELLTAQEAGIHVQRRRAGVRAVLSDDSVLLGSFSPLSEGPRGNAAGRVGQVGIHVRGVDFADAFAAALGIPPGPGRPGVPTPRPGAPAAPGRSRAARSVALPLLEQARRAAGRDGFASVIGERIGELDDPWAVLDRWENARVPAAELRRGVAVVLGRDDDGAIDDGAGTGTGAGPGVEPAPEPAPEAEDGAEDGAEPVVPPRERWTVWLVADAWRRRAFVEAAVVGRLLTDPAAAAACAAATGLEVGPLKDLLVDSALILAEGGSPARAVGAVAGMAETLLWGGPEGSEVIGMLAGALPDRWRRLGALAAEREPGRPLPMKAFTAAMAHAADRAAAETAWADLAGQIDHIERLRGRFDFDAGQAMHDGLFGPRGLLVDIRAAARDGQLRPSLEPALPRNVRRHLDELVAAAGKAPIAWRSQLTFQRRIESIVRTARELAATEAESEVSLTAPQELQYCRRLGAELATSWDELFSEAGGVTEPYGLPMIAFLERLRPLFDWSREQW